MRTYENVGPAWARYNADKGGRPGKQGKRVSFNGRAFYSYNTVVAMFHTNADGQKYVLTTSRHYSRSTSSHIGYAAQHARNYGMQVFSVSDIGGFGDPPDHEGNLGSMMVYLHDRMARIIKRWNSPRWWYHEEHIWKQHLADLYFKMRDYRDVTLTRFTLPLFDDLCSEVRTERQRRAEAFADPKAVKRRERSRARREALKALRGGR